ncbi:MAG: hypothetical protein ACK559_24230 [bacterium]
MVRERQSALSFWIPGEDRWLEARSGVLPRRVTSAGRGVLGRCSRTLDMGHDHRV